MFRAAAAVVVLVSVVFIQVWVAIRFRCWILVHICLRQVRSNHLSWTIATALWFHQLPRRFLRCSLHQCHPHIPCHHRCRIRIRTHFQLWVHLRDPPMIPDFNRCRAAVRRVFAVLVAHVVAVLLFMLSTPARVQQCPPAEVQVHVHDGAVDHDRIPDDAPPRLSPSNRSFSYPFNVNNRPPLCLLL